MTYRKQYIICLFIIIIMSVYPVYMGITTLAGFIKNGSVNSADYPKYIIPYTPISIALILSVLLLPAFRRLFSRYAQLLISVIAIVIFAVTEAGLENIKVVESETTLPLESWQYSLCVATPETLKSIGEPIYAKYNPGYKFHFYLISIVIILAVINTIYGLLKMYASHDYSRKRPLYAQAVSVILFIGLCIYACFTAFYRNGTVNISALSASLMTVFFIVFGVTVGLYTGSLLYSRRKLLSVYLPAFAASLTTFLMYLGELILMGGELYIYGNGFLFHPIGIIPFSIIDLLIILFSGVITYVIMQLLRLKDEKNKINNP